MEDDASILLIDDDAAIRGLVVLALADEGYVVAAAADLVSGEALLERLRPRLILLGAVGAAQDEAAAFLAAYRRRPGPHAAVALFTTLARPEPLAAALGADTLLHKPFELEDLLALAARFG